MEKREKEAIKRVVRAHVKFKAESGYVCRLCWQAWPCPAVMLEDYLKERNEDESESRTDRI